ncbi:hypothetical protein [Staphylococcus chromogenes]|uniref:hypothetical protein n=1 Tax=Staphylococcus chromogenes TaxID=46126 RepID=UPI001E28E8F4|nr:hypothetical protein [Staphylococcus chromogenes]
MTKQTIGEFKGSDLKFEIPNRPTQDEEAMKLIAKAAECLKGEEINMRPLIESPIKEIRISALFMKLQKFLLDNKVIEEERKVLARMLNAYYKK